MSRRRSAGSIFWGLTLMVIGGLLLARNLGYAIPVWSALALYWPLFIILWGLVKLLDYYRLRRGGDTRALFSGGDVALLIIIIFAGSAFTAAANFSPDLAGFLDFPADFDFWDITGNNYEYTERIEAAVAPGSIIEIINLYGSVDVQPSDGDQVILDVKKTVRAANREEADSRAGQFTFSIQTQDGKVRIHSSRDESPGPLPAPIPDDVEQDLERFAERLGERLEERLDRIPDRVERQRYKSSLVIRVPRSASLELYNRNGTVQVSELTGNQTILNRYGQVTLRAITGAVTIENRNAGVVVEDVSAAANITNRYGSVTARGVGGTLTIENRYGSVDVRDVKGDASISNAYSAISATNVEGQLQITGRNNSVDLESIVGAVRAETSYKNLSVRNAGDRLEARNRHGDIVIDFDRPPRQPVSISGEYGDVTLNLPSGAAFSIDARTTSGEISSEFDEFAVSSSRRERSVLGRVGAGGPQITIETRNGDIRIGKRG